MTSRHLAICVSLSLALGSLSCAEETIEQGKAPAATPKEKAAGAANPTGEANAPLPAPDFQETEFTENERSRDPFRSFANLFVEEARGRVKSQREVVLEQYSVDELKLIGIVTRLEPARAMLVDPTGVGHVLTRGQFVGRPEVVQAGTQGGASYERIPTCLAPPRSSHFALKAK
jgi:type IV pilus assembly protein PilP